jgi:hypothetical protein
MEAALHSHQEENQVGIFPYHLPLLGLEEDSFFGYTRTIEGLHISVPCSNNPFRLGHLSMAIKGMPS